MEYKRRGNIKKSQFSFMCGDNRIIIRNRTETRRGNLFLRIKYNVIRKKLMKQIKIKAEPNRRRAKGNRPIFWHTFKFTEWPFALSIRTISFPYDGRFPFSSLLFKNKFERNNKLIRFFTQSFGDLLC